MSWEQWVQRARRVPWVRLVVLAMLVLPVLLVLLAYWDSLDPQAQQALRGWLQQWLPSRFLPPG